VTDDPKLPIEAFMLERHRASLRQRWLSGLAGRVFGIGVSFLRALWTDMPQITSKSLILILAVVALLWFIDSEYQRLQIGRIEEAISRAERGEWEPRYVRSRYVPSLQRAFMMILRIEPFFWTALALLIDDFVRSSSRLK
jgi:hypothetical protein